MSSFSRGWRWVDLDLLDSLNVRLGASSCPSGMANATTPRPTLAAAGSRSPAASAYACKRESPPWCSHRPVQYEIHLLTSPAATDYTGEIAIVQASNFSTLFVLSREQHLDETVLDVSRTRQTMPSICPDIVRLTLRLRAGMDRACR